MAVKFTKPEINVREKLAELDKPSGIAGEAMLRAETPQEQFNLIGAGRRNFTINGDMKVWQRGTSFTTTNSSYYFADRWTMGSNVSNLTVSRNTGVAVGPFPKKNTLRMEATGASGFDLYQLYEEWEALSNQTVTISFWYKTNVEGVIIRQWSTASYDTVPMSQDWSYYTTTFTLGTLVTGARAANTASFGLWAASGIVSGDYFEFTNYQLELGKVATPFEHRSYGEELALCERYYQRVPVYHESIIGQCWNTTSARFPVQLPVEMRTDPTITVPGPGTSGDSMKPLTASLSWPGGSGNNAVTTRSPRHFYVTCTGYSGLVAGNASTLYAASNYIYIKCNAEL